MTACMFALTHFHIVTKLTQQFVYYSPIYSPLDLCLQGASPMHKAAFGVGAPKPQQLLLLHRGCPRTDDDVERFVLQGNFTPEAAAFDHKV